ncbi:MAG: hypothetical protein LQ345_002901, partial [Seirophora villosa]
MSNLTEKMSFSMSMKRDNSTVDGITIPASLVGIGAADCEIAIKLYTLATQISTASDRNSSVSNDVSLTSSVLQQLGVFIIRPRADLNDANSVSFFRWDIPLLVQFQTIISETPAKGSIDAIVRNPDSTAILNKRLTADTRTIPSSTHASTPLTDDTLPSNLYDGLEISNYINMQHSMSAGNRPSYSSDPCTDPVEDNPFSPRADVAERRYAPIRVQQSISSPEVPKPRSGGDNPQQRLRRLSPSNESESRTLVR